MQRKEIHKPGHRPSWDRVALAHQVFPMYVLVGIPLLRKISDADVGAPSFKGFPIFPSDLPVPKSVF